MLLVSLVVLVSAGLGFAYIGAIRNDKRWLVPAAGFWLVAGLMLMFSGTLLVHSGEVQQNAVMVNTTLADGTTLTDANVDEFRQKTFTDVATVYPFNAAQALGIVLIIAAVGGLLIGVYLTRS